MNGKPLWTNHGFASHRGFANYECSFEHPRDWLHYRVKYHGVDLQICQSFRSNCPSTLGPTDPQMPSDKLGFGQLWLRMYHMYGIALEPHQD